MQANSGDPDQTPQSLASDLGLHCLPLLKKRDVSQTHKSSPSLSSVLYKTKINTSYQARFKFA